MNKQNNNSRVEVFSKASAMRPLYANVNGQKVKVCADHRIEGAYVVELDENGNEIGRHKMEG